MTTKYLIIDESVVGHLARAEMDREWFVSFSIPAEQERILRIEEEDCITLLSKSADENSRFLVINLGKSAFDGVRSPEHAFSRILHIALGKFERTVSTPLGWKSFNQGSLLSIYAFPAGIGHSERLYFDRTPNGTDNLFAYLYTQEVEDFSAAKPDVEKFKHATECFLSALIKKTEASNKASQRQDGGYGITLAEITQNRNIRAWSLDEWINEKLTNEQREFVGKPINGPVRLRGAAGTGKTLSLAIKCLKEAYTLEASGKRARIAFVTHSVEMANVRVREMFYEVDPTEKWRNLQLVKIDLKSLYDVAQDFLEYNTKGVKPISLDGAQGREEQALYIDQAIYKLVSDKILMARYSTELSQYFKDRLQEPHRRERFISDLSNEFSSIIDAEGIRFGTPQAAAYIEQERDAWQMMLVNRADREFVLQIHRAYCDALAKDNYLSMDQMIADLNSYLSNSNEWRVRRNDVGYDIIFVDELHYFNKAERMVFHNLFKQSAQISGGRVPLLMAYDLKQSPTDAMTGHHAGSASSFFKSVGAGESELVELTKVFRYTPEISRFLADLDGAFPALDLEGEWRGYNASSNQPAGDIPELCVSPTQEKLLDDVFKEAGRYAAKIGGKEVAVLCLNSELFAKYLKVGRIDKKYQAIDSRENISEIRFAGKRPLFSIPDYVTGLQFKIVFLIHFDKAETKEPNDHVGAYRRFLSRCYSGASRASEKLIVYACDSRGGVSDILSPLLFSNSMVKR